MATPAIDDVSLGVVEANVDVGDAILLPLESVFRRNIFRKKPMIGIYKYTVYSISNDDTLVLTRSLFHSDWEFFVSVKNRVYFFGSN